MTATVLVVGATGHLGRKIARELVAVGARVRASHRAGAPAEAVDGLRSDGAEPVVADLTDEAGLLRACEGVDVVVSAVQGLRDVIVDGQGRLLRAAERAGVRRMIPSDYSVDLFETIPGQNRNLDLRRELDAALDASPVRGTSVLCGAFMDLLRRGAMSPDASGVMRYFGDPDQPYDLTTTDDVARYVAAVATDDAAGRVVRVAGDTLSPRQIGMVYAEVRGVPVTLESAGSLADLDALIERMRATDAGNDVFPRWQQLQYTRDMASGRGKLAPLDNFRYPRIRPTSIRAFLAT